MMPDLGKYVFAVLGAWGAALLLLAGLFVLTLIQGAGMRRALAGAETRAAEARAAEAAARNKAESGQ